ncbi:hypothetical protein [Arthrobacter globiformis]|uniref:hypothetical protein n=1 Tax=Arthrobacter globiformis TaxID=1665 RepID=UPI000B4157AE|nr:hypothetical protein [Arthrobacter globiformis]
MAAIATSAVPAPLASPISEVAPVATLLPAIPELPAVASVPAAVTKPVSPVAGIVADTAGTVVNRAPKAVSAVTRTVTATAAPVLNKTDSLISAAQNVIASVPPLPIAPAVPVPAAPAPSLPVPSVSVPRVPVPSVTVPSVPALEQPADPAPDVMRTAPHRGAMGNQPNLAVPSHDVPPSAVRPASNAADRAAPAAGAALPFAGSGLSLAELRMTTPERREPAAASPATRNLHVHEWPGAGLLHPFAISEGTSGSSSPGFEGSGAQAADVAGGWDRDLVHAGARVFDAGLYLPASPAFDPGCSPD